MEFRIIRPRSDKWSQTSRQGRQRRAAGWPRNRFDWPDGSKEHQAAGSDANGGQIGKETSLHFAGDNPSGLTEPSEHRCQRLFFARLGV